jgi:LuxR family maltose regulon positive regulatory protein
VLVVRVLLARDRPGQALELLDRLHALAAGQGRAGSVIEIGALRALALAACVDDVGALGALTEALTLGCRQVSRSALLCTDDRAPVH